MNSLTKAAEIARREGLAKRYVTPLTKLAFVAPAFVEAVADGETSPTISLQMLMDGRADLPMSWNEQGRRFNGDFRAQMR